MKFLEHEGKRMFSARGIRVPRGGLASTPDEAASVANQLGADGGVGRFAVKAQVPFGGRGKAGLIKVVDGADVGVAASQVLGRQFHGKAVDLVLVEEAFSASKEFYLSVFADSASGVPVLLFSESGGVDVEEAAKRGSVIHRMDLDPMEPPREYQVRTFLRASGLKGKALAGIASTAARLAQAFYALDLLLAEINPLALLDDGTVVAMDAKVEMDDNALPRQRDALVALGLAQRAGSASEDPLEVEASEIGVTYVRLDGEIGVIASGAGLGMCTMDLIKKSGFEPANFLETGGGITRELMRRSVNLVAKHPGVKGIVVNLYGGVNPLVEAAYGVVAGVADLRQKGRDVPVVVKALGNRQDEAWKVLEDAGIPTVGTVDSASAVSAVCRLIRQREAVLGCGGEREARKEVAG